MRKNNAFNIFKQGSLFSIAVLYLDFYCGEKLYSQLCSLQMMAKHPVDYNGARSKKNRAAPEDKDNKIKIFIPDMSVSSTICVCKVIWQGLGRVSQVALSSVPLC